MAGAVIAETTPRAIADRRRVVVVGPCASGKSTLVQRLRALGFDAVACGQEHSEIAALWRRGDPDVLIALDLDLATLRRRRGADWPERIYADQRRRLATARAAADIVIDAGALSADQVVAATVAVLAQGERPRPDD